MAHTKFVVIMSKLCRDIVILAQCQKFVVALYKNGFVYLHEIHNFLSSQSEDNLTQFW